MENKHKHMDFIQDVIKRMADNSFQLKGWSVALVSGLCALSLATEQKIAIIAISFIPIIVFWILDGYFLWQERLFRKVYDDVRVKAESAIDFKMNPMDFAGGKNRWFRVMFSQTIVIFYGALIVVMVAVMLFLAIK